MTRVEGRLREVESLTRNAIELQRLIDNIPEYAIFMLDADGYVVSWNPGAQSIKVYSAEEVMGRHFSMFYPLEDVETGKPQSALEIAAVA